LTTYPAPGNAHRIIYLLLLAIAISIPCATAVTLTPGSSATTTTISQGDPVYIRGIATGHPQVGLQVWFIGYNFAKVTTVQVNDDNSYEYELKKTDTANLASGQYFVLIQHPMMNGRFDVVYDASSGVVKDHNNKILYQFTGGGKLQSPDAATALIKAVSSQNIDDTFASVSFYVSQPTITFNQIGDKSPGDKFTIKGITNLAADDNLMVEIYSSSFVPTSKTQSSGFSGASGMVKVVSGSGGMNTWSFDVDTSTFAPDEYLVKVSGVEQNVVASTRFNVVQCGGSGGTCSVPLISSPVTTIPTVTNSTIVITTLPDTPVLPAASVPATTQPAPVPAAVCLGSIAAILLIRRIR